MWDKVILCPHKDHPGIKETTEKNYKEWLAKYKAHCKKRKEINFNDMSPYQQKKITKQVLSSLACSSTKDIAASTITDDSGGGSRSTLSNKGRPWTPNSLIFVVDLAILLTLTSNKELLPTPIVTNFPHIQLKLGCDINNESCPEVCTIINTAAAISTSNFHFIAAIAKKFPHCLAKIFVPEDYNPIVLSSIVQGGGECITTKLSVGFQFHLPYLTHASQPTSILIATGPHVMVNLIIKLPFIQSTGMILDLVDNVADLKSLDCPPFPIEYHCTTVHVPIVDKSAISVNAAAFQPTIMVIKDLERYFAAAVSVLPAAPDSSKHVSFGSRAIGTSPSTSVESMSAKHGLMDSEMMYYHDQDMGTGSYE
jgi:hypothetical protein